MAALVKHTVGLDFSAARTPALFLYAQTDMVVSASATEDIARRWGGPAELAPQTLPPGNDPYNHVIAGDILSPGMVEPVVLLVLNWAATLPGTY